MQNYSKIAVENVDYNLTTYDRIQNTDTKEKKYPNPGFLLQQWIIKCADKKNDGKIQKFIKSSKRNTATPNTGSTTLHPIGESFTFVETTGDNYSRNDFVGFQRTDVIQISKISYYCNRFQLMIMTKRWGVSESNFC